MSGESANFRPPAWWWVCVVVCLLLTVAGLIAGVTGAWTIRFVLGIPGAVGMLGLGLWARRARVRGEASGAQT
jgi:hypothetical protein